MRDPTSWLAALALLWLGAAPLAAQRPEVVDLRFEGARSFSHQDLASAIQTGETRCRNPVYALVCWAGIGKEPAYLDRGALEADAVRLQVYYFERGFREARIEADTTRVDDGVELVFRIDEGRPVRVAEIELVGAPEPLVVDELPLGVADPFDVVAYEATRDTLLTRLRNSGYARSEVLVGYTIGRDEPYSADVQYRIVPGPAMRFGEIQVEGTRETSETLVRRMLTFREGQRYDRSALLRSQRNLYGLQIFRHAVVEAAIDESADTLAPVRVRVAEGDMRRVRLGAGANNLECGNVEGRWTSRNFLGNGRRVTVSGRMGNILVKDCGLLVDESTLSDEKLTGLVSVDFNQPWFFGPRNNVGFGVFTERRNVPGVFVRSATGGYVSVGRWIRDHALLTLAYRPELTELDIVGGGDLFFCVNFVGCTFEDVDVLSAPHRLAPVTLSLAVDRTDAVFTPSRGYMARADLEHAGAYTASDFAYTRFFAEGSAYAGEQAGLVLAVRVRGGIGWAHPGSPETEALGLNPQKRFFAGGPSSVRGFDQYRLGPTVLGIDAVPWLIRADDPSTEAVEGAGCTPEQVNAGTCDVAALARARSSRFDRRPAGGEVLLEGNLELRFPLPFLGSKVRGAAFLDAGQVWRTRSDVDLGGIMASPGVGVRYYSPVGPIRIDAGFNPQGPQQLPVLTTAVERCLDDDAGCRRVDGTQREAVRNTDNVVVLDQAATVGSSLSEIDSFRDFFNRFNLQFSIGQAF